MTIRAATSQPPPVSASMLPGSPGEAGLRVPQWYEDLVVITRYAGAGQLYKMADARLKEEFAKNPPLAGETAVELDRPMVLVPGWTTERERFQPLVDKLIDGGRNGGRVVYVQNGDFYHDRELTQRMASGLVQSADRVFEVILTDKHAPPTQVADELRRCFDSIRTRTGFQKVDVQAYSMGGLGTRVYLDRGGDAIGKLAFVGTPHKGTKFAELAGHIIRRDIQWAMNMGGLTIRDLPALEWMAVDDPQGRNNPRLHDLNSRFHRQVARTEETLVLGGRGYITPSRSAWLPFKSGDGLVETDSLRLPGARVKVLEASAHHGHINNYPETYRELIGFFGWRPVS